VPDYAPDPKPQAAPTTQPKETLLEQITQLIQETVEPDAWRDAGGTVGAIRELSGQLIITATPQMHDAIGKLLLQIREARGVQIAVEARFISIDPAVLDKAMGERFKSTIGKSGAATVWQLADDEVQAVLKATQEGKQSTLLTAPRITLFNGQRAFVNVSTQTPYISGFTVTKKDAGETRYEPKVGMVDSGVMLDVRATASADRRFATLTLKPRLSRLLSLAPAPYPGAKDLVVQVPLQSVQELQTTLSIPDRATALIGGFTETVEAETSGEPSITANTTIKIPDGGTLLLDGKPATSQPSNLNLTLRVPPTQNLYLLVKPTLVITQPEKPKEFPILSR
jgi:general secretion pathway protein D